VGGIGVNLSDCVAFVVGFGAAITCNERSVARRFRRVIGIAFGIFTALMMSRLVAKPIDQLRTAADAVSRGNLAVDLSRAGARRADEFGRLLCEFDQMVASSGTKRNCVKLSACTWVDAQRNESSRATRD
jgi:Signal transduction histidine kinase involved in nitrogen fixation and metabolism regulation